MLADYLGCGTAGCDHTPAPRRAWCVTCSEWCSPDAPCVHGELARVQAAHADQADINADQFREKYRLQAGLASVRKLCREVIDHPVLYDEDAAALARRILDALDDQEDS